MAGNDPVAGVDGLLNGMTKGFEVEPCNVEWAKAG